MVWLLVVEDIMEELQHGRILQPVTVGMEVGEIIQFGVLQPLVALELLEVRGGHHHLLAMEGQDIVKLDMLVLLVLAEI